MPDTCTSLYKVMAALAHVGERELWTWALLFHQSPASASQVTPSSVDAFAGRAAGLYGDCPLQVARTLHRLEQAKYWSELKQRHSSRSLAAKQRSAVEGQMADCMRSTHAAASAELLAMVQAGCEEEVCTSSMLPAAAHD